MIGVRDSGGDATIARVGIRKASGNVDIARASILTASGSVTFFDSTTAGAALSISPNPISVSGADGDTFPITVQTNNTFVFVEGGTEPYTYSWAQTTSDTEFTVDSPASASTAFTRTNCEEGFTYSATFRVTVTDARGRTGTADVTARATNFGSYA